MLAQMIVQATRVPSSTHLVSHRARWNFTKLRTQTWPLEKGETPSPVSKSRHHSRESTDTARQFFISQKRSFSFVGHFSGISETSRLTIEELLQGSSADKDAITLMTAGSGRSTGGSVACILGHTELVF